MYCAALYHTDLTIRVSATTESVVGWASERSTCLHSSTSVPACCEGLLSPASFTSRSLPRTLFTAIATRSELHFSTAANRAGIMIVNKKFDRLRQWGRERMGGEVRTDTNDEFKSLELEMQLRGEGTRDNLFPPSSEADSPQAWTD